MKLAILFGVILGIVSFGQTAPPPSPLDNPQVHQIAEGLKNFGFKWSDVINKNLDNKNFITSATSTGFALTMLYLGAGGNTKLEIKKALNLPESDDVTKSVLKRINGGLDKPRKVDIKIANKIFTKSGFEIKKEFKDITKDVFRAEADNLDFQNSPDEASKKINDWVESKTNNRIKNLVSSDGVKDSSMVLVNAVYFKGNWKQPFGGKNEALFHLNDKESKNVTTMHGHGQFMYGDLTGVDAKYVILPYESDKDKEKFNMFIIIPNEINGLKNIETNMGNVKWQEAIAGGKLQHLHLDMPKFKLESTIDIEPLLKEMGVNDIFSDKADFTGISDSQQLKITKAVQKALIEVDEKGTEAAAATGIQMVPTSLLVHDEPEIHVAINRPFLFSIMMIKDHVENLLFYGRCVDPKPE